MQQKQELFKEPLFRILVGSGTVLLGLAAVLLHGQQVLAMLCRLLHVLRPLLLGVLFATMLEPSYERLRTDFTAFAQQRRHPLRTGWIRPVSLIGAILPPVLVLISLICVLVPQVMQSVRMISENISIYSKNLSQWTERFADTALAELFSQAGLADLPAELQNRLPELLKRMYDGTAALLGVLLDIGIGAAFSLYLLADKPRLQVQLRQLAGSPASGGQLFRLLRRLRLICMTFARFLGSQCRESLILGALCWAGMRLFHFPYPVLISAVIGITNIVPYFGPIAGTLPCALLLLLVRPDAVLWFLMYIVILQQIESNLIYPRVVGHSIGLPPAWVMAAIVTGGGLFGVGGMLLGVPLAAVLFSLFDTASPPDSGRSQP